MSESQGGVTPQSLGPRGGAPAGRNRGLPARIGLDQADTDKRLELAYGLRNTRAVPIAHPAGDRRNGGLETLATCGLWTRK
jgi:hypothetical protein